MHQVCGGDNADDFYSSPSAQNYHLTSILPALAAIRTPLNGLYITSPSTLS